MAPTGTAVPDLALLDANVLIALVVGDHVHHARASRWAASAGRLAICPVVEGALVRFVVRVGGSARDAQQLLEGVHRRPGLEVWLDGPSYREVDLSGVTGHRQVTDAYLRGLALSRGAVLATLDEGMAGLPGALVLPESA